MNPVSAQLEMSAAGIRVAGYVIESQMRVFQALGKAALCNYFFELPAEARKERSKPGNVAGSKSARVAKAEPKAAKSKAPAVKRAVAKPAAKPETKASLAPKPAAAPEQVKPVVEVKAAEPVKKTAPKPAKAAEIAKPAVAAKTANAAPVPPKAEVSKSSAAPVKRRKTTVTLPEFKSRSGNPGAAAPATPAPAPVAKTAEVAPKVEPAKASAVKNPATPASAPAPVSGAKATKT